jgi:hypothetical protein
MTYTVVVSAAFDGFRRKYLSNVFLGNFFLKTSTFKYGGRFPRARVIAGDLNVLRIRHSVLFYPRIADRDPE